MKDEKKSQVDVIEALLDSVLRAIAQARGKIEPKGSLKRHLDDLDDGIEFERKRAVLTDLYVSLIAREVGRTMKKQMDGDVREARRVIATMVIEEVSPYVHGDETLARVAGTTLALVLNDEKHTKRWVKAFLEGAVPSE
jgi:hypothetical protein